MLWETQRRGTVASRCLDDPPLLTLVWEMGSARGVRHLKRGHVREVETCSRLHTWTILSRVVL